MSYSNFNRKINNKNKINFYYMKIKGKKIESKKNKAEL